MQSLKQRHFQIKIIDETLYNIFVAVAEKIKKWETFSETIYTKEQFIEGMIKELVEKTKWKYKK